MKVCLTMSLLRHKLPSQSLLYTRICCILQLRMPHTRECIIINTLTSQAVVVRFKNVTLIWNTVICTLLDRIQSCVTSNIYIPVYTCCKMWTTTLNFATVMRKWQVHNVFSIHCSISSCSIRKIQSLE